MTGASPRGVCAPPRGVLAATNRPRALPRQRLPALPPQCLPGLPPQCLPAVPRRASACPDCAAV